MTPESGIPVPAGTGTARRPVDWLFRNRRTGALTVAQWPNLPLAVFLAAEIAGRFAHPAGGAGTTLRVVATVALVVWALDEIVRGVNPFRRVLGAAVLLATIATLVLH
jgi:hypothetical protein